MTRRSALLLLAALLCAAPGAGAQSRPGVVSFTQLALPDDVPADLSSAMVQDARGLVWIGTQGGLVRYDGYAFKVYRPAPGAAATLGGSYVRSLAAAPDGAVWIGTMSGGLARYEPERDAFTTFRHDARVPASLANDRVEALARDQAGRLWVGTDGGLDLLDAGAGTFRHFRATPGRPGGLAANEVRALLIDRAGRLWVGTRAGLQRAAADGRFTTIALPGAAPPAISALFEDARGRVWAGTADQGAFVLDPAGTVLRQLAPGGTGLSHFWVHGFAQPTADEVWVATFGGGIDVLDATSLAVIDRLRRDSAGGTATLGSDRIGALLVDRAGLVWAGTWGGGIARHDPSTRAFRHLRHLAGVPDSPTHPEVVRALALADGSLWLGTNGNGIDVLDATGHLRGGYRVGTARAHALAHGALTCLAEGPDGTRWAATLDGTLHRMAPGAAGFTRLTRADGLPGGPIRSMVFDRAGALWAGSLNGLARIADGRVTSWAHDPADPGSLSAGGVEALAFAPDGTLWVGTENGLNAFDPRTGRATRVLHDPARADSLPDNWVPDLMTDHAGRLWLATQSGPAILRAWDGRTARFDLLAVRLGLPARSAASLLEDAQGQVWVGSGLRIDPRTWTYQVYGPADGNTIHTQFIASRARTRAGELLFGSPEGLLMVQPARLRPWRYAPPVQATAVYVDGRELPGGAARTHLALGPRQRDLRVEFSALDYSAPHALRYRYRLDGYDADWVDVSAAQRIAAYTGLAPGDYLLRVGATNRAGQWSPAEWRARVHIAPAFWQTWWWRAAGALVLALAVWGMFRLRLRQLQRRGAQLERTVAERTAALAAAYQRIEQASLTDPLTGLRNRRYLEQAIAADLDLVARRHAAAPPPPDSDLILLMLDLDHFKQVNDTYGHAAGDAVLTQTAQVLRACMRASDHVVRWGGEEFLLVARFVDRRDGPALAEKIRQAIAAHPFALPDGSVLRKTVSIGYAAYPFAPGQPGAVSLDTLQRIADTALYAAKRSWRDAWVGVAAAEGAELAGAVRHFLADAAAAVAHGEITADASAPAAAMRWS